jgi:hypothetical protein
MSKDPELMRCWHCGEKMIWGNDFSFEDYCIFDFDGIVSTFSCSNCLANAEVYLPFEEEE